MNYTTNYHLPQWVESDRILMEDFNDAMAGIEAGLGSNAQAAAAAQTTAETADSKAAAAQATASAAQGTADNAYCPENKPYVIGTYTGSGLHVDVTLGFRPTALLIMRSYCSDNPEDGQGGYALVTDGGNAGNIFILDNGFRVMSTTSGLYPAVNWSNRRYIYIAFR